jgi:hypothetical protein
MNRNIGGSIIASIHSIEKMDQNKSNIKMGSIKNSQFVPKQYSPDMHSPKFERTSRMGENSLATHITLNDGLMNSNDKIKAYNKYPVDWDRVLPKNNSVLDKNKHNAMITSIPKHEGLLMPDQSLSQFHAKYAADNFDFKVKKKSLPSINIATRSNIPMDHFKNTKIEDGIYKSKFKDPTKSIDHT